MANLTPDKIRGFIVPFQNQSNANLWPDHSTITQGAGRAGVPTGEGNDLIVTASGKLKDSIDIKTFRGGHLTSQPGFGWKKTTDTDYNGCDQPNIITDLNIVINSAGSTSVNYTPSDAIQLSNNSIMMVYEKDDATHNTIFVAIRSYTTKVISSYEINSLKTSALGSIRQYPALCMLPDESIICAYWMNDTTSDLAQIQVSRSTDNGANWTVISSRALKTDIDTANTFGAGLAGYDLDTLSMAANSHSVLLFAGITAHNTDLANCSIVQQYASTAEGTFFDLISQSGVAVNYADPRVVSFNEAFIISLIDSTDTIGFTRLPNAFEDIQERLTVMALDNKTTSRKVAKRTSNRWDEYNRSMWIDQDGRMYCGHVMDNDGTGFYQPQFLEMWFSDLKGVTFDKYGADWLPFGQLATGTGGQLSILTSSTNGLDNIVGAPGVGGQEIFCKWGSGTTNNYERSIYRLTMGGWGTVNYPALISYPQDQNTAYNTEDWIPIDLPTHGSVWTQVTTSAATVTLADTLKIDGPTSSDTLIFYKTISDKTGGCIVHAKMKCLDDGSELTSGIQIQIAESASANTIMARVLLGTDTIKLIDQHDVTNSATGTGLISGEHELILWVDNKTNKVKLFYCNCEQFSTQNPRTFSKLELTLTTDSDATERITWGMFQNSGGSVESEFFYVSYAIAAATGLGIDSIYPKQYPSQGYNVAINQNLKISTKGGPARENDQYLIDPRYDTPIDRILYNNSPSKEVKWMSDSVADPDATAVTEQKIAWLMDTELIGAQDTKPLSDSMGIHLANINFRSVKVEKYTGAAWITIHIGLSNAWGFSSFNFTRKGNSIICSDATGKFLHFNEAEGWQIYLDDGAGNTIQRKVLHNSAGVMATSLTKNAVIRIQSPKTTDPTSGTAYLIPNNLTIIVNNIGDIAALRLTILSQKTSSGRFEIGNMIMGPLIIPAYQYSRGRTIAFEADVAEDVLNNGVMYSRKNGSGGRVVRIAWTEGVDISELYNTLSDPDYYYAYNSGEAIAAVGSAPTTALGLVNYLNGSNEAIVYIPSLLTGTGSIRLLNDYHAHVMCTLGNDVQIENVVGEESTGGGSGEVFRVSTIVLRETR